MENVVMAVYGIESEAYQAFSELKRDSVNSAYTILQIAVVKNEHGHIVNTDSFDSGVDSTDDTFKGGMIGLLVGILGGPLGVLLGGATGALIGNVKDSSDVDKNSTMLEYIADRMPDGSTALVILIQEQNAADLDLRLQKFNPTIIRWDAAEVADEIEQEQEMEKQLRKEAREKLKAQKKANRKAAIASKRDQLKADFDQVKSSTMTTVHDASDTAKSAMQDTMDTVKTKASQALDTAASKVSDVAEAAKGKAADLADSVKDQ